MKRLFILALILTLSFNTLRAEADSETMTEAVQQSTILLQLKQKLAQAQYRYYLLQHNVERATEGFVEIQSVISHLEKTVEELDAKISAANRNILNVKSQKEQKKMELRDLEEEVILLQLQLDDQKEMVGQLMTLLYMKRGVYFEGDEINAMKVLASEDTVSETLQGLTYLDLIEAMNQNEVDKLVGLSEELKNKWSEIRVKQHDLETLDVKLAADLQALEAEREAQAALLDETRVEASIFEAMLASSDENEADLLKEIAIYEQNVAVMEGNYESTKFLLTEDQQNLIAKIEADMSQQFATDEAAKFLDLDWPLNPAGGLTALFHDEGYEKAFGVDHRALDLRAKHGTLITAPAEGVVSEIVYDPNSTRYAYIVLQHRKGVSTLYGHVSAVSVRVGDFVQRGQVIGATGATPGSVGAGVRTTGPHLHFEVWQDGIRVDPLMYLPLEELPEGELPEEYISVMQDQLEDELREIQEDLLTE